MTTVVLPFQNILHSAVITDCWINAS